MIPEAKKKATGRGGLKKLTPKQMIQILPVGLVILHKQ